MRVIRQSGLEGGVRSIPHSYPYQKTTNATKRARSLDSNIQSAERVRAHISVRIFLS